MKKKKDVKRFEMRLPKELKERLRIAAENEGISMVQLVRNIIKLYT